MMQKILRAVLGVKRYPGLENRWWHRLSKVFFVVSSLFVFLIAIVEWFSDPIPLRQNVRVIDTLARYTQSHPTLANSVPSFMGLGRVGVLADSERVESLHFSEHDVMCSSSLEAHPQEVARFLRRGDPQTYGEMDTQGAATWLKQQLGASTYGWCIALESLELPSTTKIIAWTFTPVAWVASYARAIGIGAFVLLCYALVALNLYYRGFVYIVLGVPSRASRLDEEADSSVSRSALAGKEDE